MRTIATFILTALLVAPLSADVIDFESLMQNNSGVNPVGSTTYIEDGYIVDGIGLGTLGTLDTRFSGSTSMMASAGSIIALTKQGGGSFSLDSIDLAEFNTGFGIPSVTFVGLLPAGGVTSQTFTLDGVAFSSETFNFNSTFNNIVGAVWVQGNANAAQHQFDNIQVSAVPEPACGLVALLAFAGLTRRKR